jgi:DMSO/TMAO reductase YedYZ molybdopterin-dependent catalytic subunit
MPNMPEPARIPARISRRKLLTGGLAATAGAAGLSVASGLARRYGLVPPDHGGLFGPSETLTYAAQRLLTTHSMAREFSRGMISKSPFAHLMNPPSHTFKDNLARLSTDWQISVSGMVARPGVFSLSDIKGLPFRSQITQVACEEGWSYIAEWIGTPLIEVLQAVGISPRARYIVYSSFDHSLWDSIDMADALHPQTLLTWGMNDGDLPTQFGGPLRMRVPRQLGYKSVKYVDRLTVTDNLKGFGKGLGSEEPEHGYSWYAGI